MDASNASTLTASPTSIGPLELTNTTPCNGWVEFCDRKYSGVTVVGAHNSPFVRPGNSASNQQLDVTDQLNDGIRFLQAQMHWPSNNTGPPHFCHTSCDLLDAGPIGDWLGKVKDWVAGHPYDVVTILLENGNYSDPSLYAPWIEATGIVGYAYQPPPYLTMTREDWPTLAQMILAGQNVVLFLDYMADQSAYPWLLDEFSQVWETPMDPTDQAFPCTVQRPPNLDLDAAGPQNRLYLMNHNLNVEFDILGASILVPAVSLLNRTNDFFGPGSLGAAAQACAADWGVPPTFLGIDYYNMGSFSGSAFAVAAQLNNVTYDKACCSKVASSSAAASSRSVLVVFGLSLLVTALLF